MAEQLFRVKISFPADAFNEAYSREFDQCKTIGYTPDGSCVVVSGLGQPVFQLRMENGITAETEPQQVMLAENFTIQ